MSLCCSPVQAAHVEDFAKFTQQLVASGGGRFACKIHRCCAGREFLERATQGRDKIAKKGLPFIKDGAVCCARAP